MKVLAILAIRNEEVYLQECLKHLVNNNLDIFIFDNESTDSSLAIIENFNSDRIIGVESIPYKGYFDLSEQLEFKDRLRSKIEYDWIIHLDADEMLSSDIPGETMFEAISRVDKAGFNAINFNEIVFVPELEDADYIGTEFVSLMKYYYYFHPAENHRVIAFKNSLQVSNVDSAGHRIDIAHPDVLLYPYNMFMMHYICLSKNQIVSKYDDREYDNEELEKGWFYNRLRDWKNIPWPSISSLKVLHKQEKRFEIDEPLSKHFWEWQDISLSVVPFGIAKEIIIITNLTLKHGDFTVSGFKKNLLATYPALKELNSLAIAVGEEYREDDYLLKDGDEVVIIPPVSGG